MNTLIIPDIHLSVQRAQKILDREEPNTDQTVFLGDIFHTFNDTPEANRQAAIWLKSKFKEERNLFCVGNHDAAHLSPYILGLRSCPGFTLEKDKAIRSVLHPSDVGRVKLAHFVDGWLLSHAGINSYYWTRDMDQIFEAEKMFQRGEWHQLFRSGKRMDPHAAIPGGIFWQDWDDEFSVVRDLNQIVGHTPARGVRYKNQPELNSTNICLDTNLQHYAILRGKKESEACGKLDIFLTDGTLRYTI